MINLTILYYWHRYSNMWCVFWPSGYNWMNMRESTTLLFAIAIFIVHLPILYFWFDQFHLQYFDCYLQHAALFCNCDTCVTTFLQNCYVTITLNILSSLIFIFLSTISMIFLYNMIKYFFSILPAATFSLLDSGYMI